VIVKPGMQWDKRRLAVWVAAFVVCIIFWVGVVYILLGVINAV
jgi:hypothetical protein